MSGLMRTPNMDTNDQNHINLGPTGGGTADTRTPEEIEREANNQRVEAGRVKALSAQLKAKDEENEKLRAELEQLKAAQMKPIDRVSKEMKDRIDEDTLNETCSVVGQEFDPRFKRQEEALRQLSARLDNQDRERAQKAFAADIESRFPGFIAATSENGPNVQAWYSFLAYGKNREIAEFAVRTFNSELMCDLIGRFYSEGGVATGGGGFTPSPSRSESGYGGAPGRSITQDERAQILDQAWRDLREGRIDRKKYDAIRDEMKQLADQYTFNTMRQ